MMDGAFRTDFADAMLVSLKKLKRALKNPAYNFFIHTSPVGKGNYEFYHWHLEILPKTKHHAGVELATGVEIVGVLPEEAARLFRKH